jgi:DNA repair protein RecN (Recombination protein N)
MLARLSIRDIVLIERLDIEFSRGLAVLTGETGAKTGSTKRVPKPPAR